MSLNELGEKSQETITLDKFVNKQWFLGNRFYWSKFKALSHDIFFSRTFDLLWINSSKYLYIKRNNVYKYKLQRKPIMKRDTNRYTFSLVSDVDVEKSCFLCRVKFLIDIFSFSQFHHGTIMQRYYSFVLQFDGFKKLNSHFAEV